MSARAELLHLPHSLSAWESRTREKKRRADEDIANIDRRAASQGRVAVIKACCRAFNHLHRRSDSPSGSNRPDRRSPDKAHGLRHAPVAEAPRHEPCARVLTMLRVPLAGPLSHLSLLTGHRRSGFLYLTLDCSCASGCPTGKWQPPSSRE